MKSDDILQHWSQRRVIAWDYYDGPMEGLLSLGELGAFRFKVVELDLENETRRMIAWSVPTEEFEDLLARFNVVFGPSRWPVWAPVWRVSVEVRRDFEARIDHICGAAHEEWELIVDDPMDRCIEVRPRPGA